MGQDNTTCNRNNHPNKILSLLLLLHSSQKITLNFGRLPQSHFIVLCSPYVHQEKEKHLRKTRKCLIFSVDQPGLEPGTSRL